MRRKATNNYVKKGTPLRIDDTWVDRVKNVSWSEKGLLDGRARSNRATVVINLPVVPGAVKQKTKPRIFFNFLASNYGGIGLITYRVAVRSRELYLLKISSGGLVFESHVEEFRRNTSEFVKNNGVFEAEKFTKI